MFNDLVNNLKAIFNKEAVVNRVIASYKHDLDMAVKELWETHAESPKSFNEELSYRIYRITRELEKSSHCTVVFEKVHTFLDQYYKTNRLN